MSSDERDDTVEQESSDQDYEGIYEVDETADEAADAIPGGSGGGSSLGIWIAIVLVIFALIAVVVGMGLKQKAEQEAQRQREQRAQTREQQISLVAEDVAKAQSQLAEGDLGGMLETLRKMDEQLKLVAEAANTAGDTEDAQRVNAMRTPIRDLIDEIGAEYAELQARMKELEAEASERMGAIRSTFSGYKIPEVASPANQAPAEETGTEAGAGESSAAEEPAATEAPVEEPQAAEAPSEEAPAAETPAEEAAPAEVGGVDVPQEPGAVQPAPVGAPGG